MAWVEQVKGPVYVDDLGAWRRGHSVRKLHDAPASGHEPAQDGTPLSSLLAA